MSSIQYENRLLSIDPGRTTGWAYFNKGVLVSCGKAANRDVVMMAETIKAKGLHVVVESQKIYPLKNGGKKSVPANDIVTLARTAGEIAGAFITNGATQEYVLPRNWKGTIPKAKGGLVYIIEKRVLAISSEEERSLIYSTKSARAKSLDDNIIDAIGIGFWKLQRRYTGEVK